MFVLLPFVLFTSFAASAFKSHLILQTGNYVLKNQKDRILKLSGGSTPLEATVVPENKQPRQLFKTISQQIMPLNLKTTYVKTVIVSVLLVVLSRFIILKEKLIF